MRRTTAGMSLLFVVMLGLSLSRAILADIPVSFVNRWDPKASAVAVSGDRAYVAKGQRLLVFDIYEPTAPALLGETAVLPADIRGIAVSGSYVYVADDTGWLGVVSVSNPQQPVLVGTYHTSSPARSVVVNGSYLYVGVLNAIEVLSISLPSSPSFVTRVNVGGYGYAAALAMSGTLLAAAWDNRFQPFDISNPALPVPKAPYVATGSCGVAVIGSYIYGTGDGGVYALYHNGTTLTKVGQYDTAGSARGIAASGSMLYVADGGGGLVKISAIVPSNLVRMDGVQTPGFASAVALAGDYALVADSQSGLEAVSLSEPIAPVYLGGSIGGGLGVAASANHAYLATVSGLSVVDVTNPASPLVSGAVGLSGAAMVAVAGTTAFVGCGTYGLQIVNVTNPASPAVLTSNPFPTYSIALSGNMAYLAGGPSASGIEVLDVSTPASPVEIDSAPTVGPAQDIVVDGHYAYVAAGGYLQAFDVADPANLVSSYSVSMGATTLCLAVHAGFAYIGTTTALKTVDLTRRVVTNTISLSIAPADVLVQGGKLHVAMRNNGGVDTYDLTYPNAPVKSANWAVIPPSTTVNANGLAACNGFLYVADGYGRLDVLDINTPEIVANWDDRAYGIALYPHGAGRVYAYAADGDAGLQILDFWPTDGSLIHVQSLDTPGCAYSAAVNGSSGVLVADGEPGILSVDVYSPSAPSTTLDYPANGTAWSVAPSGSYIYAAAGTAGIRNVSLLGAPGWDTPGYARGLALSGNYAYVADGASGLQTVNLSGPWSSLYGSLDTPGYACGVAVQGNHALVADGPAGVELIDISDPSSPVLIAGIDTPGYAYGVVIQGYHALVADGFAGVEVIDFSDSAAPVHVANYPTEGNARGLALYGSQLFVADYDGGVSVLTAGQSYPASVIGVSPGSAPNSGVAHLSVSGSGFVAGAQVKLTRDGEDPITGSNVVVSGGGSLTCDVDLTGKSLGWWDVAVTNPDSLSGALPNGFMISPPMLPDDTRVLGIRVSDVTSQPVQASATTYRFAVWGRVTEIDSDFFLVSDGSGSEAKVFAPNYRNGGVRNGWYVSVRGTLDYSFSPALLVSRSDLIRVY